MAYTLIPVGALVLIALYLLIRWILRIRRRAQARWFAQHLLKVKKKDSIYHLTVEVFLDLAAEFSADELGTTEAQLNAFKHELEAYKESRLNNGNTPNA